MKSTYEVFVRGIEFLIAILGWISYIHRRVKFWYQISKPFSKLLGTLSNQKIYIIIPKLYSNEDKKFKRPLDTRETIDWLTNQALYAYGDAKAMNYIFNFLLSCGKNKEDIIIKSDAELIGEEKNQNLLCIGGGSNSMTLEVLTKTKPLISFHYTANSFGDYIEDYASSDKWSINSTHDYALIIKMKNIRDTNKDMIIIAGLGPTGTEAAGYYFANHWKKIFLNLRNENKIDKNFSAIIKVNQNDITDIKLIKIRTW